MSTADKRKVLQKRIEELDDKFLDAVYAMVEAYLGSDDQIVGYEPNGEPITLSALKTRIQKGEEAYERGEYTTIDDLKEEIGSW